MKCSLLCHSVLEPFSNEHFDITIECTRRNCHWFASNNTSLLLKNLFLRSFHSVFICNTLALWLCSANIMFKILQLNIQKVKCKITLILILLVTRNYLSSVNVKSDIATKAYFIELCNSLHSSLILIDLLILQIKIKLLNVRHLAFSSRNNILLNLSKCPFEIIKYCYRAYYCI